MSHPPGLTCAPAATSALPEGSSVWESYSTAEIRQTQELYSPPGTGWDLLDPKSQPHHLEEDSPTDKAKSPQVSPQNSDSWASSEDSGREVEVVTDDEVAAFPGNICPCEGGMENHMRLSPILEAEDSPRNPGALSSLVQERE